MAEFTVILLYPDWLNESGSDTYTWAGKADSPDQAIEWANESAREDNGLGQADTPFDTIAVIRGYVKFAQHTQ